MTSASGHSTEYPYSKPTAANSLSSESTTRTRASDSVRSGAHSSPVT
jgi:hypothetical protein